MSEKILRTEYSEEMQKSYLDYSMSVITSRAIPDARDGLKPVQRRVLYDMSELHLDHDKPHRKSARIVGDTMGKYHPHGDSSIYETLVVLSQDFKKGMALVDGHGNFGSIEGDGAAAMRYTEARLKKFAEEVYLKDLDKTVDFVANYDETEKEPEVLPVRVPNLLVNGAEGIAVGMSTSIPTHNLGEVIDAVKAYIDNRLLTVEELMEYMPGPDFPTGGIIANKSDLLQIYETGSGKIKLRGKIEDWVKTIPELVAGEFVQINVNVWKSRVIDKSKGSNRFNQKGAVAEDLIDLIPELGNYYNLGIGGDLDSFDALGAILGYQKYAYTPEGYKKICGEKEKSHYSLVGYKWIDGNAMNQDFLAGWLGEAFSLVKPVLLEYNTEYSFIENVMMASTNNDAVITMLPQAELQQFQWKFNIDITEKNKVMIALILRTGHYPKSVIDYITKRFDGMSERLGGE